MEYKYMSCGCCTGEIDREASIAEYVSQGMPIDVATAAVDKSIEHITKQRKAALKGIKSFVQLSDSLKEQLSKIKTK